MVYSVDFTFELGFCVSISFLTALLRKFSFTDFIHRQFEVCPEKHVEFRHSRMGDAFEWARIETRDQVDFEPDFGGVEISGSSKSFGSFHRGQTSKTLNSEKTCKERRRLGGKRKQRRFLTKSKNPTRVLVVISHTMSVALSKS